ncbi:MAG: hypothetical protein CM1200mP10_07680 [Candidatus Neomarinimicrobiota bacterium]|nr:MAG: hypothetical protein CM1200mP10_07680 [Candidatus Neomarinimicrobiota bacterium]
MARGLSDAFSDKETLNRGEIQSTLINFRQIFQQKQRNSTRKAQEAAVAEEAFLAERHKGWRCFFTKWLAI